MGTTANSINFSDGFKSSATDTTTLPLLRMSVAIGLQMGQNSGSIQAQGQGHNLLHPANFLAPATRNPRLGGLRVLPGKTLALVGKLTRNDTVLLIVCESLLN